MSSTVLTQMLVNSAVLAVTYALLALGLTMFFSVMNVMFFPAGSMYMIAAFGIYYLFAQYGMDYYMARVITIIALAGLALMIERGLYRPCLGDTLRVFFLGVGVNWFLESAGYQLFGLRTRGVPSVFPGTFTLLGATLAWQRLVVICIGLTAVVSLYLFLTRTRFGLGMRCYVESPEAAALQGIRKNTVLRMTFVLGVSLAALAGVVLAPLVQLSPDMGSPAVFKAFLVVGLGGLGSIPGSLLAAFILATLDSFGSSLIGPQFTWGIVYFLVVVFLTIRPRGLMGVVR